MDSEFKKLLAGASWAQDGDRVDMDDASVQPTIDRSQGYPVAFSTDTAPARARINQILRELTGAAKEVVMGVSEYDAEVNYPAGAMCQVSGNLYYALLAHSASSPVNPISQNQSTWAIIAGRVATERGAPDFVTSANLFIDGERADRFAVWWFASDNGGHPIDQVELQWSKDSTFATGVSTDSNYTPGSYKTISTNDSDLFYIRVRMHNSAGWGLYSAAKQVRSSPLVPGNINILSAERIGAAGFFSLTWIKPETFGLDVRQYRVQWRESSESFSTTERNRIVNSTSNRITETFTGFDGNTSYIIRVLAISNRNTSSAGGSTTSIRPSAFLSQPAKPNILSSNDTPTTIRAYINGVFGDGGGTIGYHEFSWRVTGGNWSAANTTNTTNKTAIINRDRTQSIDIRARANNNLGFGPYSDTLTVGPYVPDVPAAPTISVASSLTEVEGALKGIVSFSMNNISRPDLMHDYITQTAVRWKQSSEVNWTQETSAEFPAITDNRYGIPQVFPASGNLPTGVGLDVQARLKNTGGWGDWSDTITLSSATAPSGNIIFSESSVSLIEGRTTTLSLKLSRIPIEDVNVAITSSNTDLTVSTSSLTFTRVNWDTNQTITLTAAEDTDLITDTATLSFAISGGLDATTDTVPVTINERARLITNFADGDVDTPEGGQPRIVFGLTAQPDANVVISISDPVGDAGVTILPSGIETLTFTPNNWKTAQTITLFTGSDLNNTDDSATITFTVTGAITETFTKTLTVREHPNTRVHLSTTSSLRVGAGLQNSFNVRCTRVPDAAFTVNVVTIEPNVSASPTTLTFTRTNWNVNQSITVSASSEAPFPGLTYISLEPQDVADVVPNTIPVTLSHPLITDASFFIPEGNYITKLIQLASEPTGEVKIAYSSENDDLSFSRLNGESLRAVDTTFTQSIRSQFVRITAAIDADIAGENDPVVVTPSGAITAPTLIIPTTMAEPTNRVVITNLPNDVNSGSNQTSFNIGLLNPALEDITFEFQSDEDQNGDIFRLDGGTISFSRGTNAAIQRWIFVGVVRNETINTMQRFRFRAIPGSVESIPIHEETVRVVLTI